MIAVGPELFTAAPALETGQGMSDGTRSDWQSSDLKGLFESHLVSPEGRATGSNPAQALIQDSATAWPGVARSDAQSRNPEPLERAPRSTGAGGEPDGQSSPRLAELESGVGLAQASGEQPPISSDEKAEAVSGGGETTADGLAAQRGTQLEASVVLVAGEPAELYVRDASLDAESVVAFSRAAGELLQQHRLSLGRIKVNGQYAGDEQSA